MSVIHTPRRPTIDARLAAFPLALAALLLVLFGRLWYFQVVRADSAIQAANDSREIKVEKLAPRGMLVDRQGTVVAGVRPEIVITAIPNELKKSPDVLPRIAAILGIPVEKLDRKVKDAAWRSFLPNPIFVGATIEQGTRIAESLDLFPGIGVETQPMRTYADPLSYSHVLGYVWTPNDKDVARLEDKGIVPAQYVGKIGIERAYEADLMGVPGEETMEVDAKRRPVRFAGRDAPTPGHRLRLTIDGELQRYATNLLKERGKPGGIVAIDPKTGEVICLVSAPAFDQTLFQGGISDSEWDMLSSDPNKPMLNRAIYSAYAPGSTFKIVTAIAAYRAGRFDPNRTYFCAGGYRLGRFFKCLGHHGAISFNQAMTKSCNTYFFNLGLAAGVDPLRQASLDVGLGARSGIEIGGEGSGIVPTVDWLRAVSGKEDPPWYGGDTLNFAIGQGYLATTPLQMANVAALVANDGVSYRPHLVRSVEDPLTGALVRQIEPEVLHKVDASPEFWATLRRSLVSVVDAGTARSAFIPGIHWGGKTGSAEHGPTKSKKTHSWFVGFAPADNPKIAICVMVEEAGHGGEVAAPIAKIIVDKYLRSQGLLPQPDAAPVRQ